MNAIHCALLLHMCKVSGKETTWIRCLVR